MNYLIYRIYFIQRPSVYYIGITNNISKRRSTHLSIATGSHTNRNYIKPLYAAIRTYGKDSMVMEVLERGLDFKSALKKESEYIAKFNSIYPGGYNIAD